MSLRLLPASRAFLACASACLAAIASACAGEEPVTPFATPAARLSRTSVPLGSPLEVTYRFAVLPGVAPLQTNYRVLAHFVDADGELMWTDDHDPPTPTSTWKPGETIEYRRIVFIPIYPYVGEAALYLGLYSPDEPGRVPLQGEDDGLRSYKVATLELRPQSESVFIIFKDGWHLPESAFDNPMVEWQWTQKQATLSFRNLRTDVNFYLHFDGRPDLVENAQQVTISIRGEPVETFTLTSREEQVRKIAINAAQLGTDDLVELTIAVDKGFVPAEVPETQSADVRELGIRVFHAYIEPSARTDAGS